MKNPTSPHPTVKTCPPWCSGDWHQTAYDVDHYSDPQRIPLAMHTDDGEHGGLGLMLRQGPGEDPQLMLTPPDGGPAAVLSPGEVLALIGALAGQLIDTHPAAAHTASQVTV